MQSCWKVVINPAWKRRLKQESVDNVTGDDDGYRIRIKFLWYFMFLETDLDFSDMLRFAVHVPAAASADGMVIMMYHMERHDGGDGRRHAGIGRPRRRAAGHVQHRLDQAVRPLLGDDVTVVDRLHLAALPSKLLVVRVRVVPSSSSSSEPESFDVFELGRHDGGGELEWRKVDGDGVDGGNYDLFLDGHHATIFGCGGGGRIYYVHEKWMVGDAGVAAYCYRMRDGELECVYKPPPEDCMEQYSTKPSWFVP
uniref:DUF295 domain-containing protein n=1 Tax=Leersia perrieri TaxID=77586 RepID=A0A0D9XM08_9ORYZ